MLIRGILLAAAIVACGWFGIAIRQANGTKNAAALVSPGSALTAAQARSAAASLNSARFLNPDRAVEVLRAKLALDQHHPAEAQQILERVTRAEPKNLDAWLLLAQATLNRHQPIFGVAIRTLARLDPRLK